MADRSRVGTRRRSWALTPTARRWRRLAPRPSPLPDALTIAVSPDVKAAAEILDTAASLAVLPEGEGAALGGAAKGGRAVESEVSSFPRITAGPKGNATTGSVIANEAKNANAQAALKAKLSGLQKAQETAAVTKTLPDGRIRYYTQEVPARTEGATWGASFVTEFNPKNGNVRQWMESYDQSGSVIRIHPKNINGQAVDAQHYPATGVELKIWGQ
jgi:hypothetical protein